MAIKRIADLPGLGPKSQARLAEIGINSPEAFLSADAYDLYRRLKATQAGASLNFLYAMLGAQQNRPWQAIRKELKEEILFKLDDMGLAPK